ncbi:APC family permease [Actinoplanes sp. Pm04-4]|uniref:APC family permease n=1 Tax=Paractinoplanes pyxinae TaxID=2997416 RepID=A0ABT4BC01_9ACTN|nr:APC family permease [Actinoplanes pyxinae]MCY1144048.1 APC family permease [Actinoplanes pyxinae]
MNHAPTLARYSMTGGLLFIAAVVASSPLTVLAGGIPTTYARTGVAGVPLSFLLVMVVLGVLMVAKISVGRHVRHGAPFYAQLAHVSPAAGLAAAGVAFVGYNALQISLYPLLGVTMAGLAGTGPWWVWAGGAWLVVLLLGRHPGAVNAQVLGVLLALEIAVIGFFVLAGFSSPAGGAVSADVLMPSSLFVLGAAAPVLVFAMAAFAGVESVLAYGEEATSARAVAAALAAAVGVCGVLYCAASWAYASWLGLDQLQAGAADPDRQPLDLLEAMFGSGITVLATAFLVTSVLAAMISFHATVARYVFALAREQVLPRSWATVSSGAGGGAPLGGSRVQAVTAAAVLAVFGVAGADPMTVIFPWLSALGALCVLLLLTAAAWSALVFFARGHGRAEPPLVRRVFPLAGGVAGVFALTFMASNLRLILDVPTGSARPWLIAVPIAAAVLTGLTGGAWLRRHHPDTYTQLGRGVPQPARVLDPQLNDIEV